MSDFIPWPTRVPARGNCDMLVGPCACGATHAPADVAGEINDLRGRLSVAEEVIRDWERGYGELSREAEQLRARIAALEARRK